MSPIKISLAVVCATLIALLPVAVKADITQAFKTKGTVRAGNLVSLTGIAGDTVEASTEATTSSLLGVATEVNSGIAQVATTGAVSVLVSNVNGNIDNG